MLRLTVAALLLATFLACEDSVTFPNISSQAALTGTWAYRGDLSGDGFDCRIDGLTFTLQVSGTSITGTASPGTIFCSRGVLAFSFFVFNGDQPIVNGLFSGNDLQFDFGTAEFHNEGIFSSNQMIGDVALVFDVPLEEPAVGTLNLTGTFEGGKLVLVTQ